MTTVKTVFEIIGIIALVLLLALGIAILAGHPVCERYDIVNENPPMTITTGGCVLNYGSVNIQNSLFISIARR